MSSSMRGSSSGKFNSSSARSLISLWILIMRELRSTTLHQHPHQQTALVGPQTLTCARTWQPPQSCSTVGKTGSWRKKKGEYRARQNTHERECVAETEQENERRIKDRQTSSGGATCSGRPLVTMDMVSSPKRNKTGSIDTKHTNLIRKLSWSLSVRHKPEEMVFMVWVSSDFIKADHTAWSVPIWSDDFHQNKKPEQNSF